jgi:hypothetical protein
MDLNTENLRRKIEDQMRALDAKKVEFKNEFARKVEEISRKKEDLRSTLTALETVESKIGSLDDSLALELEALGSAADQGASGESSHVEEVAPGEDSLPVDLSPAAVDDDDEDLKMVEQLFSGPKVNAEEPTSGNGSEPTLEHVLKEVDPSDDSVDLDLSDSDDDTAWSKPSESDSLVPKFLKKYL